MNVVDSRGWLEYFADGPNAEFFAPVLEGAGEALVVPTLCLYEVFKSVLGQFGRKEAIEKAAVMRQAVVIPLTDGLATQAALVSHGLKLPMADSVILTTARSVDAVLWTQDAHFENVEGVRYRAKQRG